MMKTDVQEYESNVNAQKLQLKALEKYSCEYDKKGAFVRPFYTGVFKLRPKTSRSDFS